MKQTIYYLEDDLMSIKTMNLTIKTIRKEFECNYENNLESYLKTLEFIPENSNPIFILDGNFPKFKNEKPQFLFPEALKKTKNKFPNSIIFHYSGSEPIILKERKIKYQIPVYDKCEIDCLKILDEIKNNLNENSLKLINKL